MIKSNVSYSGYRWLIMALSALSALAQTLVFLSPAVFIPMMMKELNISVAEAGISITIVLLMAGLSAPIGGMLIQKVGIKHTRTIGLMFFSVGGLIGFVSDSFLVLMIGRILAGVGMGIGAGTGNAVTMDWFPEKERPSINAVNSLISLAGAYVAYAMAVPILNIVGSWQNTLGTFGVILSACTILWIIIGRENKAMNNPTNQAEIIEKESGLPPVEESVLRAAFRRKEVKLLILAYFTFMLANQSYNVLLPTYFQTALGMDPGRAGEINGYMPLAAIGAGILSGVLMTWTGRRKIFMWPLLILLVLGCLGSVTFTGGPLLLLSVIFIGICLDGWIPPMFTSIMELKGMTPKLAGAAQSLVLSVGLIGGCLSTFVVGWLAGIVGLKMALLYFAFPPVIAVICTLMFPETGPGGNKTFDDKVDKIA